MAKSLNELVVVKVLNSNTIVLNAGENDGMQLGMKFLVYELGEELIDPESGESLGNIEIVRGKVSITHLQPRLATGETFLREKNRTIKRYENPFASYAYGKTEEVTEDVAPIPLKTPKVGDRARRIS